MKAVKNNKVYTIDEASRGTYLSQGFDITDDNGDIIERSPSRTVSYEEYSKVVSENKTLTDENKKLKAEIKKLKKDEAK